LIIYSACQKEMDPAVLSAHGEADRAGSLVPCGSPFDTTLINYDGLPSGTIEVMNDSSGYHVVIREPYTDYKIGRVQLLYGTRQHVIDNIVGLTSCATMQPRNPDKVVEYKPAVDSTVVIDLPFDSLSCFFMNANITLVKTDASGNVLHSFNIWSNGTSNPSQNPCQQYFQYCRQRCDGPPPPPTDSSCGKLRTESQKDWGDHHHDNHHEEITDYLLANFAGAFPGGLRIGCDGGYTLKLTSAQAVIGLLPSDGKAERLKKNYVDPKDLKNKLIGELVALTLNVGFDKYDENFGEAGRKLSTMYIRKGKFHGKTVAEFLAIANNVLGKCSGNYKPEDLANTAKKINENYKHGKKDKHYLACTLRECDDHDDGHDGDDDHDDDDDHDHDHG